MEMIKQKDQQGITLVALVVTIIVLLILAGVTISLVLGQAGIFSKAEEAKEKTTEAQAIEKVKLAVLELRTENNGNTQTITLEEIAKRVEGGTAQDPKEIPGIIVVDGFMVKVNEDFGVSIEGKAEEGVAINLPSTAETTPYAPKNSTLIEGTNLENGLVIKDKNNNEWVWVEVPKSITASSNTDAEIETALETYAADYKSGDEDTWYEGCGLTETEYNNNKSKMLQSIKSNGGFWIGRYEAGTDVIRTAEGDALTTLFVQQDKYPYNWVTVSQAQKLSSQLAPHSSYISSLPYGIQWDLTCKYMEEKGYLEDGSKLTKEDLITDATKWGNYSNANFDIIRGQYSRDDGATYTDVTSSYTKSDYNVLLTTGASERNKVLNIYDFAGNEWEWTLLHGINHKFCVFKGGSYNGDGILSPAKEFGGTEITFSFYGDGFRPTLYK